MRYFLSFVFSLFFVVGLYAQLPNTQVYVFDIAVADSIVKFMKEV